MKTPFAAVLAACATMFAAEFSTAAETGADLTRLASVMARIQAGQLVKVAAIGGSITTGYAAAPPEEQGWAGQIGRRLSGQSPTGKVQFVNLGVSGTDSAAAVQRVRAQVIDPGVDLVLVEFGVNDQWLAPKVRQASYEGLLRQLLKAPSHPAVVTLHLTQQGNRERDAVEEQLRIARHYRLPAIDFGKWMDARARSGGPSWQAIYGDEPIHPNRAGHDQIAAAIVETLEAAQAAPGAASAAAALPAPLHGDDYEYVRHLGNLDIKPYEKRGFASGSDRHDDWERRPGGGKAGWTTKSDDATISFLVYGRQIALFHPESEHYRDLEAWVDDGKPVTLREDKPERAGYLGWAYTPVASDLEPGAHLLHVRVPKDKRAASGRVANIAGIMTAGLPGSHAPATRFVAVMSDPDQAPTVAADHPDLRYVGRFDKSDPKAPAMAWTGSEIRARFTGRHLALRMQAVNGIGYFNVEIDGRRHRLDVAGDFARDYRLAIELPAGEHEVSVWKRSEALFSQVRFHGLLLDDGARLLAPPAPRALKLEFYGDSITAGACNGDGETDQYEDMSSHDGARAYGAVAARRLNADYVGVAVSGTGIVKSWNEIVLPDVFDRIAASTSAPRDDNKGRQPDVVVVNLGQNDFGLPQSLGEPFPKNFTERYVAFIRKLRERNPDARIVATLGGMSGWLNSPELKKGFDQAVKTLQADDSRLWSYRFKAYTDKHPRIDTHELLANELTGFLRNEVLK